MSPQQYNHIVKTYSQRIFAFVFKSTRNRQLSEDITQDSFLSLWDNRRRVNNEKVKSWLFTAAHNKMLNALRKEKRIDYQESISEQYHPRSNENQDDIAIFNQAIQNLKPKERSLILLRDIEGYNYGEIGEILQLSSKQVKAHLFRARKKMKEIVEQLSMIHL